MFPSAFAHHVEITKSGSDRILTVSEKPKDMHAAFILGSALTAAGYKKMVNPDPKDPNILFRIQSPNSAVQLVLDEEENNEPRLQAQFVVAAGKSSISRVDVRTNPTRVKNLRVSG